MTVSQRIAASDVLRSVLIRTSLGGANSRCCRPSECWPVDQVLQRLDALYLAIFVDDKGHVHVGAAEGFQQLHALQCLGHVQRPLQQLAGQGPVVAARGVRRPLPRIDHAEDVVQAARDNREASVVARLDARLAEGMVRAYLVEDRVAGFGHQAVNALHPEAAQPGTRLYHGPELAGFQELRQQLESDWVTLLRQRAGLAREQLPLLRDCDFMLGEAVPGEPERFVPCEINVSSVSPFPPSSISPLVEAVKVRLARSGATQQR